MVFSEIEDALMKDRRRPDHSKTASLTKIRALKDHRPGRLLGKAHRFAPFPGGIVANRNLQSGCSTQAKRFAKISGVCLCQPSQGLEFISTMHNK